MARLGTDEKRLFVVASGSQSIIDLLSNHIQKHIYHSSVYTANDGIEALFKMENTPPHVLIVDLNLPKLPALELVQQVLYNNKLNEVSIILISPIPDKENFVDQVVTCQVQFLTGLQDEILISSCITKALNRLVGDKNLSYRLRFLAP